MSGPNNYEAFTQWILLGLKKEENFTFVTAWTDLNIMLTAISQSEKDKHHMISLICGI